MRIVPDFRPFKNLSALIDDYSWMSKIRLFHWVGSLSRERSFHRHRISSKRKRVLARFKNLQDRQRSLSACQRFLPAFERVEKMLELCLQWFERGERDD